jgi:hypothetical protein
MPVFRNIRPNEVADDGDQTKVSTGTTQKWVPIPPAFKGAVYSDLHVESGLYRRAAHTGVRKTEGDARRVTLSIKLTGKQLRHYMDRRRLTEEQATTALRDILTNHLNNELKR